PGETSVTVSMGNSGATRRSSRETGARLRPANTFFGPAVRVSGQGGFEGIGLLAVGISRARNEANTLGLQPRNGASRWGAVRLRVTRAWDEVERVGALAADLGWDHPGAG